MPKRVHAAAWKVMGGTALVWVGIHAVAGQHPTHQWYDDLAYALVGIALIVFLTTTNTVQGWFSKKPRLVAGDVHSFRRTANASKQDNDLEVVYAKVRNAQNGGGEKASLIDAEVWMEAFDPQGHRVAHCQGNWFSLRAGVPDPNTLKSVTLRPTGEEVGLELGGKFGWGDDAWLAGETHPSLTPGSYRIKASVSDGVHKATIFEWQLTNPGKSGPLLVDGVLPRLAVTQPPNPWAGMAVPGTAIPIVPVKSLTAEPSPTLTELVAEEGERVALAKGAPPLIDENDPDYQLRQAITGAISTLRRHWKVLSDRKLFYLFDPTDRGQWGPPADQRKFLLKAAGSSPQYLYALQTTDEAFAAVGLLNPETMYNDVRLEAIAAIGVALPNLDTALTIIGRRTET